MLVFLFDYNVAICNVLSYICTQIIFMKKGALIYILPLLFLLTSCYKKQYEAAKKEKQRFYNSYLSANNNATLLKRQNDSLSKLFFTLKPEVNGKYDTLIALVKNIKCSPAVASSSSASNAGQQKLKSTMGNYAKMKNIKTFTKNGQSIPVATPLSNGLINSKTKDILFINDSANGVYPLVTFKTYSYQLNHKEDVTFLKDFAKFVNDSLKGYKLLVIGNCDQKKINKPKKNIRNNWDLSNLRSSTVVNFLIKEGVEPGRIISIGRSSYSLLCDPAKVLGKTKKDQDCSYMNRSVIIKLIPNEDLKSELLFD